MEQNINFTKDQYISLLEMAYITHWVITKPLTSSESERISGFDKLNQYLYAQATHFQAEDIVVFDEKENVFFLNEDFRNKIVNKIHEYDKATIFHTLIPEFAERDYLESNSLKKMPTNEDTNQMAKFYSKYEKELKTNGIKKFYIQE
ncbi:MAG: hypothetical protein KF732_09910 [Flavobacteriales bacterium]|nr:hypothetical protein [Flavobacteriales bacterium]